MRSFLLAIIVGLSSACCAPGPAPLIALDIVPEVWLLSGTTGRGSAVPFFQDGDKLWLLTVAHNLPMETAGNCPIEYQEAHPDQDLALIMVRVGDLRFENLPQIAFQPGFSEPVRMIGWHAGAYLVMTDGYIGVALDGDYLMSCPMTPGCSGGAIIDEDGRLIGLARAILRGHEATSMGDWVAMPYAHVSFYQPLAQYTNWISGVIAAH